MRKILFLLFLFLLVFSCSNKEEKIKAEQQRLQQERIEKEAQQKAQEELERKYEKYMSLWKERHELRKLKTVRGKVVNERYVIGFFRGEKNTVVQEEKELYLMFAWKLGDYYLISEFPISKVRIRLHKRLETSYIKFIFDFEKRRSWDGFYIKYPKSWVDWKKLTQFPNEELNEWIKRRIIVAIELNIEEGDWPPQYEMPLN